MPAVTLAEVHLTQMRPDHATAQPLPTDRPHHIIDLLRLVRVFATLTAFRAFTRTGFVRESRQLVEILASLAEFDDDVVRCVDVPPGGIAFFAYLFVLGGNGLSHDSAHHTRPVDALFTVVVDDLRKRRMMFVVAQFHP